MSLIAEAPNFLQVYSDGTVKRFEPETALPSPQSSNHFRSKDITIDSSKPITGRIFIPNNEKNTTNPKKLHILIYFHGGGFCIGSTKWLNYHTFLGDLASQANIVILSIDYRLAPENRLPIAYLDGLTSLEWLASNNNLEPWLNQGDLSRVFLSGDSAGGNIAHNVAIMAINNKIDLKCVEIKGLLLIHPFFGSEKRTLFEIDNVDSVEVTLNDMFWKLSIPDGGNRDYFGCNFEVEVEAEDEGNCNWSRFPRVVVFVAGLDFLKERGVMYGEFVKRKLVKEVKVVEEKDEGHVYHVYYPHSKATCLLRTYMADFINGRLFYGLLN